MALPRHAGALLFTAVLFHTWAVPIATEQSSPLNYIQQENAKPGTTDWQLTNPGFASGAIEGYASLTSVNRGGRIKFFVNTADPTYTLEVFRIGYYQGLGGRRMTAPVTRAGTRQVIPSPDPATGLVECNWVDPYVLDIPATADPSDWMSGFYLVKLTGSSGKQQYIHFVVRDDGRNSDVLLAEAVTTAEAYNVWGGKSLYGTLANRSDIANAARKVSFDRPYYGDETLGAGNFFNQGDFRYWEWGMVSFLEANGYDVAYATNIDVDANAGLLLNHRAFLSVGHDEYWSWTMRDNVERARDSGVNLGFFSANTSYWQVRFENSPTSNEPTRVMVGYKDYCAQDPISPTYLRTCRFRDSPVNRSEDRMLGVMYVTQARSPFVVEDESSWVLSGTGLRNGAVLTRPDGSFFIGYEVDAVGPASPPGVQRIGHSPATPTYANFSDMVTYRADSGATVFSTGSIMWTYDVPAVVQITKNVLARLISGAFADTTPVRPLPPQPLQAADIGDVGRAGFVSLAGAGSFTLNGGGQDAFAGKDALFYVYQPWSGDGQITVRLASLQLYWGNRAGVMIRETLDPASRYVSLVGRPSESRMNGTSGVNEGAEFRVKDVIGGSPRTIFARDLPLPNWLKLARIGNTFYAMLSADGINWVQMGTVTVPMSGAVYVGTSVASAQHAVWATARFANFAVTADTSLPAVVSDPSLPANWANRDIGAVGPAGGARYDGASGTFTVTGAGADVWNTADAFHYAYTPLRGNGSIVARVATVSAGAAWIKAGVMLRGTLNPSSAHGFMLVSYAKGSAFQRRVADGGVSTNTSGGINAAPFWVRLDRAGTTISAYQSVDGVSWTPVSSDTFQLGPDVYAGLVVSSHTSSALATATFDHVAVTPAAAADETCPSVTLSKTFYYSGASASNWNVTVTAPTATCRWTAAVDQPWILLNGSPGPATLNGVGSATIKVSTLTNTTGAMRYGQFAIAGTAYKVTQEY